MVGKRSGIRVTSWEALRRYGLAPALACLILFPSALRPAIAGADQDTKLRVLVSSGARADITRLDGAGAKLLARRDSYLVYEAPAILKSALESSTSAVVRDDFNFIELRRLKIDTRKPDFALPERLTASSEAKSRLMLVQFVAPPVDEDLALLKSVGASIVHYIPQNAYLIWVDEASSPGLASALLSEPYTAFVGEYHPWFALSPALDEACGKEDPVRVTVQVFNYGEDAVQAADQIAADAQSVIVPPREVLSGRYINVSIEIAGSLLESLAAVPGVVWIEPYLEKHLNCERQGQILADNLNAGRTAPTGPGYLSFLESYGFPTDPEAYPVVVVTDDGFDNGNASSPGNPEFRQLGDPALASRVVFADIAPGGSPTITNPNAVDGHGNINTSIVGGCNNSTGSPFQDAAGFHYGLGISPYGRMAHTKVFSDSGLWPSSINEAAMVSSQYARGVRISSNSWGTDAYGEYTSDSQMYDSFVRDCQPTVTGQQPMAFFFSAGNEGSGSNSIGSPATGKNVIAVGASENYDTLGITDGCDVPPSGANNAQDVIDFSSRGPCDDGRAKPEIQAPGTHIQGAASTSTSPAYTGDSVCDKYMPAGQTLYCWSSGTSHSCPAAAGCGSLVYNFLSRTYGIAEPSPALLKAYIIHSGRHMTGLYANDNFPSNSQGFGIINLAFAFDAARPRKVVDQTEILTGPGEQYHLGGVVADGGEPLVVSLAWTDPPGALSGAAYVNNLDLEVYVDGVLYRGNVFNKDVSQTGGAPDVRNNYELVRLPAGTSGAVDIVIRGVSIGGDGVPGNADATDQDFALVACNLVSASADGVVMLDKVTYRCGEPVSVKVLDSDLAAAGECPVTVSSSTGDTETVTLAETPEPGVFAGQVETAGAEPVQGDGVLQIGDGALITASYEDADNGSGLPETKTDTATADCRPISITNVAVNASSGVAATVTFATNVPTLGRVHCSMVCGGPEIIAAEDPIWGTAHTVELTGLSPATGYVFVVEATDVVGTVATDDNGGQCYPFTTASTITVGTCATTFSYPLHTYYEDSRTQVLYLASELGGAPWTITSLSLNVSQIPGQALDNWNIRMKHTIASSFTSALWECSPWTTVFQASSYPVTSTGWKTFTFPTPFEYNGSDNLIVDFSHNGTDYTSNGLVCAFSPGGSRSLVYQSDSGAGDPLTWCGSSPAGALGTQVPQLRLGVEPTDALRVSPSSGFTSTGQVGGPFIPDGADYTLQNMGTEALTWAAVSGSRLAACSQAGGVLAPGESATVRVSLTADVNALTAGDYSAQVRFSNMTTQHHWIRVVSLHVIPLQPEIEVTDSLPPADDLQLPFGPVFINNARTEHVTIANTGRGDLEVSDVRISGAQYREDFEDGAAQGWEPLPPPTWTVLQGEYSAYSTASGQSYQSLYAGDQWADGSLSVTLRRTGYTSYVSGLCFRCSDDFVYDGGVGSAYGVGINAAGSFWVIRFIGSTETWLSGGWTSSPYLATGEAPNLVNVSFQGSQIRVYFNGNLAWSGTDSGLAGPGRIGLFAYRGAEVKHDYFDNVVLDPPIEADHVMSAEQEWYCAHPFGGELSPDAVPEGDRPVYPGPILPKQPDIAAMAAGDVFSVENLPATPFTIPAGGDPVTFDVKFQPDAVGEYEGTLVIASSDETEPSVLMALSGSAGFHPSDGRLALDRDIYSCADHVVIELRDAGLAGMGAATVTAESSAGDLETVILAEVPATPGVFSNAESPLSTGSGEAGPEDGTLQTAHQGTLSVTYLDADDGTGGTNVTKTRSASLDCAGPVISAISSLPEEVGVVITFTTDEPAIGVVKVGTVCGGPYTVVESETSLATAHSITVEGLARETEYFFVVEAADAPGNSTLADNGGQCYTFTTPSTITVGTCDSTWSYPLHTYYDDSRTQVIYLASELMAGPSTIVSLALNISQLPGQTLDNWNIRMKHTTASSYATAAWECTPWTTVYQAASETVSATGWKTFTFTTPFDYNGNDNLIVDFSHNSTDYTSNGLVCAFSPGGNRSLVYHSDSGAGDPLTWCGTSPAGALGAVVPQAKFGLVRASGMPLSEGKAKPDGAPVFLQGLPVTYAAPGVFYVEDEGRNAGIRVHLDGHALDTGMRADIVGKLSTNEDGERFIAAAAARQSGLGDIVPVFMRGGYIGGEDWMVGGSVAQRGIRKGLGLNNIGLLIQTSGVVTLKGRDWFYIDDGSGVSDGTGTRGVFVWAPEMEIPAAGVAVVVTGISSCEAYKTYLVSTLLPRTQSDIVVVAKPGWVGLDAAGEAAIRPRDIR